MKKLISAILCVVLFVLMVGCVGYTEHRYIRENCVVVMVEGSEITVEDTLGNWWTFEGDGFEKGDKVNLKVFDSCTGTMEDDIIEGVERVG